MPGTRSEWVEGIKGNFPVPNSVLPNGSTLLSAEKSGTSAWTKTAKLEVKVTSGEVKHYFFKCITGKGARALTEGEYESAMAINKTVPGFSPKPAGWGEYMVGDDKYFFYLGAYHNIDLHQAPNPAEFSKRLAMLHRTGTSPNGKFGFSVPTVCGIMERTVAWESSWAVSFTHQLKDVIQYDNETNGVWPELEAACKQLIDVVIPRLLGALQSDGRSITPSLIHGDLWENNVGIDTESGDTIVFDPGCTYAHNEMEFGTWRCTWTSYFGSPAYMLHYQRHIQPSEPVADFDDRNRLYSIYPYLTDSAGHPGSYSRKIAFNDIMYPCDKYAPIEGIGSYNPDEDISITGRRIPHVIEPLS